MVLVRFAWGFSPTPSDFYQFSSGLVGHIAAICLTSVSAFLNDLTIIVNILRPSFRRRYFQRIFLNENVRISIKSSLKFVPKGPINNIPALVQVMAWHRPGDKPLTDPMAVRLLTHICVTRPQWVKPMGRIHMHLSITFKRTWNIFFAQLHLASLINIDI